MSAPGGTTRFNATWGSGASSLPQVDEFGRDDRIDGEDAECEHRRGETMLVSYGARDLGELALLAIERDVIAQVEEDPDVGLAEERLPPFCDLDERGPARLDLKDQRRTDSAGRVEIRLDRRIVEIDRVRAFVLGSHRG